jgi:hypothetical protein
MDLLRNMIANRHLAAIPPVDPKPARRNGKKPTKTDRAKEHVPGSRTMRTFIIEEKPAKKIVKDHLEAIVERECQSSSDGE